jgi:hypothetical protein
VSGGAKNLVYVATSHDSVYAFDADNGTKVWGPVNVGHPIEMPNGNVGNLYGSASCVEKRFINQLGVTATPVLDPTSGTLYVLAVDGFHS